jgi:sterol desaturase/sphingolipid hydroxylase (fatty acid hydroxylase superfamily)
MARQLIGMVVALVVAGAVLGFLEWRWPALRGRGFWQRRGHLVDLAYWFGNPVLAGAAQKVATVAVVVPIALLLGAPLGGGALEPWIAARRTIVSIQPAWLQAVEVIVLADFVGYWTHRLFHGPRLWRFHAVHHASVELDWLSAVRAHPLNEALTRVAAVAPLFALGFRGEVLAGVTPLFTLYALGLHANVPWTFGPLRHVLASPAFHRWHHTAEERGRDKNFAALFPVWDVIFGTFWMPPGEQPSVFGVSDAVPSGFFAQLVWPFRARRGAPALRSDPSP